MLIEKYSPPPITIYYKRSLSFWNIQDSVTWHIDKGVKKSQRISRMTIGHRSNKKVPTMWRICKTWLDEMEKIEVPFSPFVPMQKLLKNQVTAWLVSQLSLLFSYKRREGFFAVVIALLCFAFKKCFSKFRKGKLNLCQVIIEFCGYSLLLSSRVGNFPPFLQTAPSHPQQWSSFSLDLFSCRESVPKQNVFDIFGYSTKIQAWFYPSKNLCSPNPKDNSS